MRKIWRATIALICMIQPIIHANPFIPGLVQRFEDTSDMRPIMEQLRERNLSASTFVRLAAKQKVQQALEVFRESCDLSPADIQEVEYSIQGRTTKEGPITYRYSYQLQEKIPALKQVVEKEASPLTGNFTVCYGSEAVQAVARRQADRSYAYTLRLPRSFLDQSEEEQAAILGHEYIHLQKHHNERLLALETFNRIKFGLKRGKSLEKSLALFQNGTWSIEKASDSETLQMVCKAHELEADWLALLHNNPRSIQTGMERILTDEEPDPEHPSNAERLAWARKIVDLLELEKQLMQEAQSA